MNSIFKLAFVLGLALNAWLTRIPLLRLAEQRVMTPLFIKLTRLIRGRPDQPVSNSPEDLGREWERLLGSRKYARVVQTDELAFSAL